MTILTDDKESWVIADYYRLKQVLVNVVDNAMKFTAGKPKAEIKISSQVLDDQIVMIVEDNGSGISPEDLKRVKEKFYKADSTVRGSGIGLAVADEPEAVAAGRAHLRIDHGEHCGRGYGGIHGIAAFAQYGEAGLRGQMMRRGDHAVHGKGIRS